MNDAAKTCWGLLLGCVVAGCSSTSGATTGDAGTDTATADTTSGDTTPVDGGSESGGEASTDAAVCPTPVVADPLASQRASCTFLAGDHASKTLGLDDTTRKAIPLQHIIVMMKENRSFDHMLGGLRTLQPDADLAPSTFTNLDKAEAGVPIFHEPTTCIGYDPDHQWAAMHNQVNGGAMDGFVTSAANTTGGDGHFVMGYYDQTDLPFLHFLASTYAINDKHFAAVRSGTFPNRDYLYLGTSDGVMATQYSTWPSPSLTTIFDEISTAGFTWAVYGDDFPLEETLDNPKSNWSKLNTWKPVSQLLSDLAAGTVANVIFVDGRENVDDDHPTADVQVGEAWTKSIYDAAVASPVWSSTAILLTYDEAGGFADHVPPPNSVCLARPQDSAFYEAGTRIPMIAISPWARRHYVSHVAQDHTSITRFIEAIFDLPALTARDANSDGMLDMFDFGCAPATIATAPSAGTGGCGGAATLTLNKTSFASGESIVATFAGGPGGPKDWITVYPRAASPTGTTTLYDYCATGSHLASSAGVTSGTVTLTSASDSGSNWPLAAGTSWTAYYMVNGSYTAIASVEFDIHM